MRTELDNFIIESDVELDYFNDVVNHIMENEKRILDFFKLEKLPSKIKILIISYEPFKDFVIAKSGEILDYVCGDSDAKTKTIRILNIEDQIKYTTHKDVNVDILKSTTLHEIVHQCHQVYNTDYIQTTWFSEGLATNISNQNYELKNLEECDFEKLKDDFRHYKGAYAFSYTIVNYILNNYSEEEISNLYTNSDYLRSRANTIFEEAKFWINNRLTNKNFK